jgi:hypothetical protein
MDVAYSASLYRTTRDPQKLLSIFPSISTGQLEATQVSLLTADHSDALKGVDALIHCASPIFTAENQAIIDVSESTFR